MARNLSDMHSADWEPRGRGGKKKAARAEAAQSTKQVHESDRARLSPKGDSARVGIPTRQPTSPLVASKGSRVGIPTRQPAHSLGKPTGVQRAISKLAMRKHPLLKR